MKIPFLCCASLLLLIPQCAKVRPEKTFEPVQDQTQDRIGITPYWDDIHAAPQITPDQRLPLHDAIRIGIDHNPTLQANFETIGISKADLVQAGFYSNPHVESIFRVPHQSGLQNSIELSAQFTISDLWQVPRRKKVAQKNLEVKTYEIITEVMQLRKRIQLQYLMCLYHQRYLELVNEITSLVQDMKERIEYRYQFGYNSDLDRYFAASKLAEWRAQKIDAKAQLHNAYIAFHELLGFPITSQKLSLTDTMHTPTLALDQNRLTTIALESHPLILVEQSKIARAQAAIKYEKSRFFKEVNAGITYERDFEKSTSGTGPSFGITVPIFDTNYGNIERAKFEKKQSEKSLSAQKRETLSAISRHFLLYQSYLQQIRHYQEQVIPSVQDALAYSKKFFDRMQMNMIVFLETQINLLSTKMMLLDLTHKAAQEYVELEFASGLALNNKTAQEREG